MKKLLVVFVLLGYYPAFAECCPKECEQKKEVVCKQPRPRVITRTKVVEKPVPVIVEKEVVRVVEQRIPVRVVERVPVKVTQTVIKKENKKNRISGLVGSGPTKLSIAGSEARLERGIVYGLQYQRMLDSDLSVGVQVQSNGTISGSVSFDF
jgi:hypothetical protein